MKMVGNDPLGQALASRLHREAVVLDGTQVWATPDGVKALKKLQGLKKWPFKRLLIEQSFLFRGDHGWAAVYVPRTEKDNDYPGIDLMVSTEQGVDVKHEAVNHDKDVKALPAVIAGLIGNIEQVYIIVNANQTDLTAMRLKRRTSQDSKSIRPGVRSTYPQPMGRETDLVTRATPLTASIGLNIKRQLRTALRREEIFLVPGVDIDDINDMLDTFGQGYLTTNDILSRHSYSELSGWWERFLQEAAVEKFNYNKKAGDLGNKLTASQVVEVAKLAKEKLLDLLLKKFFRKTKRK